jgi:hypothetical protein
VCAGSVRQVGRYRDGRVMLEREVNLLGRQRGLGKPVFVRVQHAVSQRKLLLQCSACSEDTGATDDVFVTAYLTDDLMS